jgi:segregation and condensation protein B
VLDDDTPPEGSDGDDCRVSPATILEAMLFVGLPDGAALTSRRVAALMRGVRPQEIDDLAAELKRRYRADNCPYEIAAKDSGWVMRLRPEFARFGRVVESRSRTVRLDAESLDVLALVAWNQPVPRDRIVELGCDARPSVWRQLVRRGLLELVHEGHGSAEPSYRTTRKFLEVFRLGSIDDLPEPTAPPR